MSNAERHDAVVIGSGEGGKYLAWHLAQAGERTAVVERRWVGGSCPNINCLPSKKQPHPELDGCGARPRPYQTTG